ncbi:hypothetical protein AJ79_09992 [Helicocarpus griseus UAMH5409]|uniref:GPR1/FUN34/YaaH-class plasma membrane protein n=1 Tax=Helicocarpus griseus UAMH5409 TaxID=1447875 RepID=A0A2B7WGF4_9EURO|nr:hypothetical protein AJ79_09992 [Helicocarpus griseus UAMH5409]
MSSEEDMNPTDLHIEAIRRTRTAESVVLPRDVFEKLYLNPKGPGKYELGKKFGNPTPIALIGFVIASTPFACTLMGWRGAGGHGGALLTVFIFFGGLVQLLGAIGEWLIGNTFACAIFFTYGTFWIVQGTSLQPFFGTGTAYSPTGNTLEGQTTSAYYATLGFYYVSLTMVSFVFVLCSLRSNICLFTALVMLVAAFGCVSGSYFQLALGNSEFGHHLQFSGGALVFALVLIVWYIMIAQILDSVDFPISLPVGDLSTVVPGRSERIRRKNGGEEE